MTRKQQRRNQWHCNTLISDENWQKLNEKGITSTHSPSFIAETALFGTARRFRRCCFDLGVYGELVTDMRRFAGNTSRARAAEIALLCQGAASSAWPR